MRDKSSALSEEDVILLCGDTSWGKTFEGARGGFSFSERDARKKKLLLKGIMTTGGPQRRK
jgi:predicted phosphohydrolase